MRSPAGEDYICLVDINHVLGKLFDALAANRISVKRAAGLAYIADLLMRSQEGAKQEVARWDEELPVFQRWWGFKYGKEKVEAGGGEPAEEQGMAAGPES
ncbi:MAG TPA: hypothetical protein VEJ47_07200 [Candidatus Eremiobacteraceae bacterium]|nr:hypothetical protein [Candidatus Eremiobacteraceae bacterium]